MDHQTAIGSLLLFVLANFLGVWRVTAAQSRKFDERFVKLKELFDEKFYQLTNQITKILEGDIRELRQDAKRLNETLEAFRERSHKQVEAMNALNVRVVKLEEENSNKRR